MNATISKTFTFDAAHQLHHHDGKCANLHGHTYKVVVFAEGKIQPMEKDGESNPEGGMVLDFYKISRVWKEHLEPRLDHKNLNDSLGIITTAEILAGWVLERYREYETRVQRVQVWETPTSCAEVSVEDLVAVD